MSRVLVYKINILAFFQNEICRQNLPHNPKFLSDVEQFLSLSLFFCLFRFDFLDIFLVFGENIVEVLIPLLFFGESLISFFQKVLEAHHKPFAFFFGLILSYRRENRIIRRRNVGFVRIHPPYILGFHDGFLDDRSRARVDLHIIVGFNYIESGSGTVQNLRNYRIKRSVYDLIIHESDVRFIRVNVYVNHFGRHFDFENVKRIFTLHKITCVGVMDSRLNGRIYNISAV